MRTATLLLFLAATLVPTPGFGGETDDKKLAELLSQFDNGNGSLDTAKLKEFYRRSRQAEKPVLKTAKADVSSKSYAPVKEDEEDPTGFHSAFLLRKDFSDIFLFDRPTPASQAQGATVSFEHDGIGDDNVFSVHGMIALPIDFGGQYADDARFGSVIGFNVAPYIELDLDNHSNAKSSRTMTLGGTGEIGFDLGSWSSYLRGSLGVVNDQIDNYTDIASSAEWIPVSLPLCIDFPCGVPGTPIIYRFQPSLLLQYDHASSGDNPFSDGDQSSLRLGPSFAFVFKPFGPGDAFWNRVVGHVSYHIDHEFYSGASFDWLDAALTYNLTPSGNLGLTGGYERGEDEKTADKVDKFTVSLSGKL
ncbi:hypothetical protein NKI38_22765 [Mesorhizobium sp. M0621]|uniref:hypothetical protein n=1 Tax=Mesorhizobium sp. M0621 TaxID=2956974 RepID=UPI0033382945